MKKNRLRKIREELGLTISELSKLSGVTERTIRYIENNERSGKRVTRQKLVNGLNNNPTSNKIIKYEDVFSE